MPHKRKRQLGTEIQSALKWAKSVAILGMRQSGKTTLMRDFCRSYFTLDDGLALARFRNNDWSPLEESAVPVGLDEAQKLPQLFDRVKLLLDQSDRPGRFILSGSVRFLDKKSIRESLTGRVAILELLPLTVAESHDRVVSDFLSRLSKSKGSPDNLIEALHHRAWIKPHEIQYYLLTGGLPGICFKRDAQIRAQKFEDHLDTILTRDIQLIYQTQIGPSVLKDLLLEIVLGQGEPLRGAPLARRAKTSPITLKRLLAAFESLFLIRKIGDSYYCLDQGLASHLVGSERLLRSKNVLRFVMQELAAQLAYHHRGEYRIRSVRTRGGLHIPFLIDLKNGPSVAICTDSEDQASDKTLKSLTWHRKRNPETLTVAIHSGEKSYVSGNGHLCLSWRTIV